MRRELESIAIGFQEFDNCKFATSPNLHDIIVARFLRKAFRSISSHFSQVAWIFETFSPFTLFLTFQMPKTIRSATLHYQDVVYTYLVFHIFRTTEHQGQNIFVLHRSLIETAKIYTGISTILAEYKKESV